MCSRILSEPLSSTRSLSLSHENNEYLLETKPPRKDNGLAMFVLLMVKGNPPHLELFLEFFGFSARNATLMVKETTAKFPTLRTTFPGSVMDLCQFERARLHHSRQHKAP